MAAPRGTRAGSPPRLLALSAALLLFLALLLAGGAAAQPLAPPALRAQPLPPGLAAELEPGPASGGLMLQLRGIPAALVALRADLAGLDDGAVDAAGRSQLATIAAEQLQVERALAAVVGVEVLYSVQNVYNGIAVRAEPELATRLAALPGVRAVHPLPLHERTNSSSVRLIGAPALWGGVDGITGEGVRVGIIDTGIDYLHTNFGGPGVYTGSDHTIITDPPSVSYFGPGRKVAGGYDFVGDDYNGSNAPTPDPDPLDCPTIRGGGHGSHVAGTAAGLGVAVDGSTYAGAYSSALDLDALRIGPGVAPRATLYAIKVFGCTGATQFAPAGIDWAIDPNGDGNFADRLDVINLSLGSPFGTANDPSAVALDNAVALGVVATASAGNSGDVHYIGGSPGSAGRAITVANSVDATDTVDGFRVENTAVAGIKPAGFSASFGWASAPPVTANLVYTAGNTTGCSAFSGADAALVSGRVVLVDWAPEGTSNFPCGSAGRANNAAAAGAAGLIIASGQPFFDSTIAGNAAIPAVFTTFTVGTELKSVLTQGSDTGVSVTLSNTFRNSGRYTLPAIEDTLTATSSRGPQGLGSGLKPDVAAPGTGIFSADSASGTQGKNLTGTSMAAPHVAGLAALLLQQRPGLTPAELKALVINNARHDIFTDQNRTGTPFAPARVGAGRVDAPTAAAGQVIAYDTASPDAVSVSFGAVQVLGSASFTRTVTVRNFSATARSYAVGYVPRTDLPGVRYSFPDGGTIEAPSGGSASFRVVLSGVADEMRHVRETTLGEVQGGVARHWLSEESGLITLTPAAGPALRLPVYATARPAASLSSLSRTLAFGGPTASTAITFAGTALRNPATAVLPAEQTALVAPLELQHTSPQLSDPALRHADLRYVGVASDAPARAANATSLADTQLVFGIATWGDWTRPVSELQFSIAIDRDRNGSFDVTVFTAGTVVANASTDVFVVAVGSSVLGPLNGLTAASLDTAAFNNNVLLVPIPASALGIDMSGPTARFNYRVEAVRSRYGLVDSTPTLTYDARNPGLTFGSGAASEVGLLYYSPLPGQALPAVFDQDAYRANSSQGALLLHPFNRGGERAEVLPAGLAQAVSFSPLAGKTYGDVPFSVSATAESGLPVTIVADPSAVCTVAGGTVTIVGAGECRLTASQAGNQDYVPASRSEAFTVAPAPLTIRANDAARAAGRPNPAFTATYSGFVNGDGPASLDTPVSLSSDAGRLSRPGAYPISAAGAADPNYAITHADGVLIVTGDISYLPLMRR